MSVVARFDDAIYHFYGVLSFFAPDISSSTTLATDSERRYAGAASALLEALSFASGGIVSPLAGIGNIFVSTGITFVVCAICSLLCALWAMRRMATKVAVCRSFS